MENIILTNNILTNNILNMEEKYIHQFLDLDYCNKEFTILKNKIIQLTAEEITILSDAINSDLDSDAIDGDVKTDIIAKYYIKLSHLFATIFNIASNNFHDNKMVISDISNCIPEIKYLYKTVVTDTYKYVLNELGIENYNKHLSYFNNFVLNGTQYKNYSSINLKNLSNRKINTNKMIFESNFNNYTYYLTILLQKNKVICESLLSIINKYFIFNDDHIKNIVPMKTLDLIINEVRNILIGYFFDIENAVTKVTYFFNLFLFEQMGDTIENRLL